MLLVKPKFHDTLIVVRGGGDIATGAIHRLYRAGFPVVILEIATPSAIRRKVSFCEAVYDGTALIEGVKCTLVSNAEEAKTLALAGGLPLLIDESGRSIAELKPTILVDAILAKKNMGTHRQMADFVMALGPGFSAGDDDSSLHCVVETMRGHNLGRLIYNGKPLPNTGVPGPIMGVSAERVIHSPATGTIHLHHDIGDIVEQGDLLAEIYPDHHNDDTSCEAPKANPVAVTATITGVLRGIIRNDFHVTKGLKIADIDPRASEQKNSFTISDKSRAIGGSVLDAVMSYLSGRG